MTNGPGPGAPGIEPHEPHERPVRQERQNEQAIGGRHLLIGAAVLVVVAVIAATVALTVGAKTAKTIDRSQGFNDAASAPSLPALAAADWIQTPPLTAASLRGKVVLVDFWDASCINCRRTFPFLRALADTYRSAGLVVLGVHSPEFAFEKSAAYVTRSARELGVTWPVANDPDMTIWNEFRNQYWPAQYLVDRNGKLRLAHAGEGDDTLLENNVRALLDQGGSAGARHVGAVTTSENPGSGGTAQTPETYLGAERGDASLPQGSVPAGRTVERNDPDPQSNAVGLRGSFTGSSQFLTANPRATVALNFTGRDVYVILAPSGKTPTTQVTVRLNGRPVPVARRGPSVAVDAAGETVVRVTQQDLFHILTGPAGTDPSGTVTVTAGDTPVDLYTFTFGA